VKLNLLFIVMDLLTLLAYPVVYMHGLLRQASGSRKNSPRLKMLAVVPLIPGG
jgi:hypothetical protein